MMDSPLPLLVFDLDGVLVDSEKISERLYVRCLQQDGFAVDTAFYNQYFLGRSSRDCLVTLQDHFGRQPSAAALEQYDQLIEQALRSELEPVPFVREALLQLPHPKCVASGSELQRIQVSLETAGLAPFFQNITSSYEVERGKPAPDVFLRAAEKNNYTPANCMVIEDTIFGVEAGLSAGMKVLCYQPDSAMAYNVPEGVEVFDSMKRLPDLVKTFTTLM
ncbi:MAG TPA: HAD family phosphatase [Flavisolibacter sp.]|jgi:HAD superfamily hydrolase (TIGR01509 family)|nr:HAD family phosphatase [Flavisolibacter sp.]